MVHRNYLDQVVFAGDLSEERGMEVHNQAVGFFDYPQHKRWSIAHWNYQVANRVDSHICVAALQQISIGVPSLFWAHRFEGSQRMAFRFAGIA